MNTVDPGAANDDGRPPARHVPIIGADQLDELPHLPPSTRHARMTALRDQALADYRYWCQRIEQVRVEMRQGGGQVQAAKALGLSRATIRRAGKGQ